MAYPGRTQIYETTIRRMVMEALKKQEELFALEHRDDSNEQLLSYLAECAQRLEHSPYPKELIGWSLILQRFPSWEDALAAAGLAAPTTQNRWESFRIVKEETLRQKEQYRQNRIRKRQLAQKRLQAQKKARQASQSNHVENIDISRAM